MWDARAIIVAMLAGSVAAVHVVAIIGLAIQGRSLTDVGGDVMIALVGAIIAIIAGYVSSYAPSRRPELPPEGTRDAEQKGNRSIPLEHDSEKPESGAK